jgi:hypothetical protein
LLSPTPACSAELIDLMIYARAMHRAKPNNCSTRAALAIAPRIEF